MADLSSEWDKATPITKKDWDEATPISKKDWDSATPISSKDKSFLGDMGKDIKKRAVNTANIFTKDVPAGETLMQSVNKVPLRAILTAGIGKRHIG